MKTPYKYSEDLLAQAKRQGGITVFPTISSSMKHSSISVIVIKENPWITARKNVLFIEIAVFLIFAVSRPHTVVKRYCIRVSDAHRRQESISGEKI